MTAPFLPYARQCIEDDDIAAVVVALKSAMLTTGPLVDAFDAALASATGARFALCCNSGTAALHMALAAQGLGPGDGAIVPAITFVATANAVRFCGAEPIFADVDPDTGLMGPEQLEQALRRVQRDQPGVRVRTVLPVHLGGQCADPERMRAVAATHGLAVIEDACHALGTTYDTNIKVGACAHSAMACFSFHPVKTVAMGEGGAVTTNDPVLAEKLRRYRSHAITREAASFTNTHLSLDADGTPNPWYYEMSEIMPNYRAPDILCALGLSQLAKLDRFAAARKALARAYDEALTALGPGIKGLARLKNCDPVLHLYAARLDFEALGATRAEIMRRLKTAGIGTQVHYIPVPWQPYYAARAATHGTPFPGAAHYYAHTLSLPLFVGMTPADVTRVVEALRALRP